MKRDPIKYGIFDPISSQFNTYKVLSGAVWVMVNCLGYANAATIVSNKPDIAVSISSPIPELKATALSEVPVTITNIGSQVANAPINLSLPLPSGFDAPLKFARNAEAWVCVTQSATIKCVYNKSLSKTASTTIRLPVIPQASSTGAMPGAFQATVAAVPSETVTANNTSAALKLKIPVGTLKLRTITDPNYSTPLLDPTSVPKYATPLANALAPYFRHTADTTTIPGTESYNLDIKLIKASILPPGFPSTDVYAYGDPQHPESYSYPAHSIIANSVAAGLNTNNLGKPVKINFTDSRDPQANHLLPVDHSIHGAMAQEPDIRSVAHLHGVKLVDQNSDGYPEGWSSPNGKTGSNYSVTTPTQGYNPNGFDEPNNQIGTLMWFHDHTLGMTRLNVYAGLAGLYLLRDSNEQNLISSNSLPNGAYELPLVLQDRMFHADGTLAYPDVNPTGAASPNPSMVPEFYGDVMVVNGVAWPYLDVEPRRYRFRMLNGSSSRFYTLKLSNNAAQIQVLGTEGGFLAAPAKVNSLTIAPGERYDLIIDFTGAKGQAITLTNSANSPFPGGTPVTVGLHDQIMQFRVNQPLSAIPNNPLPKQLPGGVSNLPLPVADARQVLLAESVDNNGRILPILGTVQEGIKSWMDLATETPKAGSVETWEIFNNTVDAHPIHLHGGHFVIQNRQDYLASVGPNNELTNISLPKAPVLPSIQENTWKDTVITYPGQVTRIKVKFENPGLFVWHCHILEHEDHDMMRPLIVQP